MKKLLTLALLAGLSMVGCTEPIVADQNPYVPSQVTMTDAWIQKDVYVKLLPPERTAGSGQLKAPIEIYNKRDWELTLDYTYTFVDKSGTQVDNPPHWEFLRIPARGSMQIAPLSMSAAATDFRVQLRRAK